MQDTPEVNIQREFAKGAINRFKGSSINLVSRNLEGGLRLKTLHKQFLRDENITASQIRTGVVIKLHEKNGDFKKNYFLFFNTDNLPQSKKVPKLTKIIIENPRSLKDKFLGKFERYEIILEDSSIKARLVDEDGEKEIALEDLPCLDELDILGKVIDKTDQNVTLATNLYIGVSSALIGAAILNLPIVRTLNRIEGNIHGQVKEQKFESIKNLSEKMEKADAAIEKIKKAYGLNFDFNITSQVLFSILNQKDPIYLQAHIDVLSNRLGIDRNEIEYFLKNERSLEVKKRLEKIPEIEPDSDNRDTMLLTNPEMVASTREFVKKIMFSFLKTDKGRVQKIFFGSDDVNTSERKGKVTTSLGAAGFNFNTDELKRAFHETNHSTNGVFDRIYAWDDSNKKALGMQGYRADTTSEQMVEWLEIFANNPDFFKKYFFNIEGDGTYNLINERKSLESGLVEIMAIGCTNYFFGERGNWMGEEIKKYPDIEKAIRRQLAITINGVDALYENPDGLNDLELQQARAEFGRSYILAQIDQLDDGSGIKEDLLAMLKEDVSKYYYQGNENYLYSEKKPESEYNNNFFTDNKDKLAQYLVRGPGFSRGATISQINDFIIRYGRTFFPNGKIFDD